MEEEVLKLKIDLKKKGLSGIALDIDETLSYTMSYWFPKLMEMFGNPENSTPEALIKKYRYSYNVPFWQSDKAIEYIIKLIDDDKLQTKLPLIENSNHYANKLNEIIPVVAYITSRPVAVTEGTKKWLETHNFPKAPVIMRPTNITSKDGSKHKAEILEQLYPEIVGIVDDNPSLVRQLSKDYKGHIFLYDSVEHDRPDLQVFPSLKWDGILKDVRKVFSKN